MEPDRTRPRLSWLAALWTFVWAGLTAVLLFLSVAHWTGLNPSRDAEAAMVSLLFAGLTGAMAAAGMIRSRSRRTVDRPPMLSIPPPRPRPGRQARLPGPESSAYEPMRRLTEAEASLGELLRQLRSSRDRSAVPPDSIEDAWHTADDAGRRVAGAGGPARGGGAGGRARTGGRPGDADRGRAPAA